MLQLYVTDYVINSFLYAAHRNHLLNFVVAADPSQSRSLADKLQTTCDQFCIGDLLYPIQDEYPDHWVDIEARTTKVHTIRPLLLHNCYRCLTYVLIIPM